MTNQPLHKNQAGQPSVNGGHFASVNRPESDTTLGLPPVTIRVRREAWDGRDNLMELGTDEFEGRAILDAISLDEIDVDYGGSDDVFFTAVRLGLVEEHDGPFTVELHDESVAAYLEARASAGQVEALADPPRPSLEQAQRLLHELDVQREALNQREIGAIRDAVIGEVLIAHPTAHEIELFDASELNEGDPTDPRVWVVRDAEGNNLWAAGESEPAQHPADSWLHRHPVQVIGIENDGWFGLTA